MPGRYQFSLPERPQRDGWFRIGTLDVTTTALLVLLGVVSMFVYAADKVSLLKLAFLGQLVRDGDVWRLATWPLVNPPDSIWVVLTLVFFWWVGHRVEDQIGRKRFTVLIAATTIVSAGFATALNFDPLAYSYGLGVLGIGLLAVFALDNPGAVFFFGIPIWVIAAAYVGIDVLRYVGDRYWETLVLELAVIVVALFGARQYGMLEHFAFIPRLGQRRERHPSRQRRGRDRGRDVVAGPWQAVGPSPADQFELDSLLDKISASGMESLTREEKQRLNELSKRLRGS